MLVLPLALYALSTSLALVFLKLGSQTGALISYTDGRLQINPSLFSVLGIGLYGISFLIYTFLVAKYDLGYIVPIATAVVYVLVFMSSFVIFKESFTVIKICGIALILGGILLIHSGK